MGGDENLNLDEEMLLALSRATPPSDDYVHVDEREDVLASLELLTVIVPLIYRRPLLWKWMIIGAQSALQGAMVCALVDSTGSSVLNKKSAAELLDWLEADDDRGSPPKERLEEFEALLKKSEAQLDLALDEEQRKDITRLHSYFRNSFIHFTPKGWGIQKAGLPRIICAAIDATESLMGMDRMGARLDEPQRARFVSALRDIRTVLGELESQYNKDR